MVVAAVQFHLITFFVQAYNNPETPDLWSLDSLTHPIGPVHA